MATYNLTTSCQFGGLKAGDIAYALLIGAGLVLIAAARKYAFVDTATVDLFPVKIHQVPLSAVMPDVMAEGYD